jgi:hypothetical protein
MRYRPELARRTLPGKTAIFSLTYPLGDGGTEFLLYARFLHETFARTHSHENWTHQILYLMRRLGMHVPAGHYTCTWTNFGVPQKHQKRSAQHSAPNNSVLSMHNADSNDTALEDEERSFKSRRVHEPPLDNTGMFRTKVPAHTFQLVRG